MKLLLIDKQKKFRLATKKLLAIKGFEVLTAARWSEVLPRLQHNVIHVVLLGVDMPDISAVEALKTIKRHSPLTQVVVVSGADKVGLAADCLECGAIDYLIKPVLAVDLIKTVKEAFDKRQTLEQKIRTRQIEVLKQQFGCCP